MQQPPEDEECAIRKVLASFSGSHDDFLKGFERDAERLHREGVLILAPDHKLKGKPLEWRVRNMFREMGFSIQFSKSVAHDGVLEPPDGLKPKKPVVLEIKSSKNTSSSRDDRRQLDDWVFESSGEEKARKKGLGGNIDPMAIETQGMMTRRHHHPTPHKGVMIFNGNIGTPFEQRPQNWLEENLRKFAEKRNFCIVSFHCFFMWYDKWRASASALAEFWTAIHGTCGVLKEPKA